jgi:hypothetical protein
MADRDNVRTCIVFGCRNCSDTKRFIGALCSPCYKLVTEGIGFDGKEHEGTTFIHILIKQHRERGQKLEAARAALKE